MADFTNLDDNQIENVISAFNRAIDNFLKNVEEIKKIHGVTNTTDEVMIDLLALSRKETTLDKIKSLHSQKSSIIKKKSEISFEIPEEIRQLMLKGSTPYFMEKLRRMERRVPKLLLMSEDISPEETLMHPPPLREEEKTEKYSPLQYFALGKISAFESAEMARKKRIKSLEIYAEKPPIDELELKHQVGLYTPDPMYSSLHIKEGGVLYD